jgi:hypothetical protein
MTDVLLLFKWFQKMAQQQPVIKIWVRGSTLITPFYQVPKTWIQIWRCNQVESEIGYVFVLKFEVEFGRNSIKFYLVRNGRKSKLS